MRVALAVLSLIVLVEGQFVLPKKAACDNRKVHFEANGKRYHFSWLEVGEATTFGWEGARNYCRNFCMDSVSIKSVAEYNTIKGILRQYVLPYTWTAGRKCNFNGCDRPDLQPVIENGWFWAARREKIPRKSECPYCDWSRTGGLERPQPDNREFSEGGADEACIAILNNFYNDGIKWHDVNCAHKKPIICEEITELLEFVNNNDRS